MMKFCQVVAAAAAAALFSAGCANYRIGTTLPSHLKTVYTAPFVNHTDQPQIESTIAGAVRQEFQRDGQLKLAGEDAADIVVECTLRSYTLEALRYDANSPKTAQEYRAIIRADINAYERANGNKITKQSVSGSTTLQAVGDLVTARRNALPDVADDLAKDIVDAVISAW